MFFNLKSTGNEWNQLKDDAFSKHVLLLFLPSWSLLEYHYMKKEKINTKVSSKFQTSFTIDVNVHEPPQL